VLPRGLGQNPEDFAETTGPVHPPKRLDYKTHVRRFIGASSLDSLGDHAFSVGRCNRKLGGQHLLRLGLCGALRRLELCARLIELGTRLPPCRIELRFEVTSRVFEPSGHYALNLFELRLRELMTVIYLSLRSMSRRFNLRLGDPPSFFRGYHRPTQLLRLGLREAAALICGFRRTMRFVDLRLRGPLRFFNLRLRSESNFVHSNLGTALRLLELPIQITLQLGELRLASPSQLVRVALRRFTKLRNLRVCLTVCLSGGVFRRLLDRAAALIRSNARKVMGERPQVSLEVGTSADQRTVKDLSDLIVDGHGIPGPHYTAEPRKSLTPDRLTPLRTARTIDLVTSRRRL
jgi:hypothetical protein